MQTGDVKMNMFEEALSIKSMLGLGKMTQGKVAEILGVSQPYVANKLRLLIYSPEEREKILRYGLSERHARTILRISEKAARLDAIERAHAAGMNVARCEIMVDTMLDEALRNKAPEGTNYAERIGHFERSLESSISLLREVGIRARASREESGNMIYFRISIG